MVYKQINKVTTRKLIGNKNGIYQRNILIGCLYLRCIFTRVFQCRSPSLLNTKIILSDTNVTTSLTSLSPYFCPNYAPGNFALSWNCHWLFKKAGGLEKKKFILMLFFCYDSKVINWKGLNHSEQRWPEATAAKSVHFSKVISKIQSLGSVATSLYPGPIPQQLAGLWGQSHSDPVLAQHLLDGTVPWHKKSRNK